jgi:hypothetical protein
MASMDYDNTYLTSHAAISSWIQNYRQANAVMRAFGMNVSSEIKPGDRTVSFPYSAGFTASNKVKGTPSSEQTITYLVETLEMDQTPHVVFSMEDDALLQSHQGIPVDAVIAWVPQIVETSLGISFISYNNTVRICIASDESLIPDPEIISGFFSAEFESLYTLAKQKLEQRNSSVATCMKKLNEAIEKIDTFISEKPSES